MSRVAIFDVDGTLYNQKKLRLVMLGRLLKYYVGHPWKLNELYGIYYYRKVREKSQFQTLSDYERIKCVAKKCKCDNKYLETIINRWMFKIPLDLVKYFQNDMVIELMKKYKQDGYMIAIYSDYPVEDKLNVLKVNPDFIFYPGHGMGEELKPSEKAMKSIIDKTEASEIIYVGDRDKKDGASARLINATYIDVADL